MFSRFFIDRPIFASVLSIVIALAGAIAVRSLPIAQYPPITPPTIQVMCNYPGASAQVVAETVAAPIEQQVNGVEDMLYMSSQCTNDGSYNLTVTFKPGIQLNFAQVLVQNRVNLALPQMPDVVKQTGVTTRKRSPDILLLVSLDSPDNSRDNLYLSNYATIQLVDELKRVEGVGDVFLFGQQDYSMRIWLNPDELAHRDMTASDVINAVREQNSEVASGQVGQPPMTADQQFQFPLATLGRLSQPEQFADLVLKAGTDGQKVTIRDVGHVELGAKSQDIVARLDGMSSVSIAIFQLPDANALETADRIHAKMAELRKNFPPGVDFTIAYDTTPFIRESVDEVFKTLRDAVLLVALVVLLFLQNWRATIIPLVAVPVAILGTFAAMAALGFSLNNLTLFGLVLAIGIVVDDAIVVVEAVEHHMEHGLAARDATIKAMEEVSGPVIAVALVLSAVFLPCAFISGITGQFFRQFALTIACSTLISALNSLTLSPALSALLLKPKGSGRDPLDWLLHLLFGWGVFRLFNWSFVLGTALYTRLVRLALRGSLLMLLLYGGLLALTYLGFQRLPTGFIPNQDKGYLVVAVQLPDSASLERTRQVVQQIDDICHSQRGVTHTISTAGQSFTLGAYGSNFGNFFVTLDDFSNRKTPELYGDAIAARIQQRCNAEVKGAIVNVFGPPPVSGLGTSGGFKLIVEDRGDVGLATLQGQTENLIRQANQQPQLQIRGRGTLFTVFRANSPQLFVDVNREEAAQLGIDLQDIFNTLQVYLGSLYINDFNRFGRTWQVVAQAEARFRNRVEEVKGLKVRNNQGQMIPLGTVASVRLINGPLILTRYNMYPAAVVTGIPAPGVSSGQAIELMQTLANRELPANMSYEWTEITYMQQLAGNTALVIFALAVVFVFLVLAALYESWSLPLAVILVVPLCLLSALAGVAVTPRADVNIFTQIGFVVLVGLASKNAILIVEFAKVRHEQGAPLIEGTLEACRLRLRPILMTSFAFILGVVPLLVTTGAGAEMRQTLGLAVFSGMLGVTLFGIFLTPVFFYVLAAADDLPLLHTPLLRRLGTVLLWMFLPLVLVGRLLRETERASVGREEPLDPQEPPARVPPVVPPFTTPAAPGIEHIQPK